MQYKTGTATFTNGSEIITGVGTEWLANVSPGDYAVRQGSGSTTFETYTVGSVVSDNEITLTAPYGGATASNVPYAIHVDFHPNGAPKWSNGDVEFASIQNKWNEISVNGSMIGTDQNQIPTNATTDSKYKKTYNSVAEMKFDPDLEIGYRVSTVSYILNNSAGGLTYEIVAAGTGVDDGGSYINLPASGLQAKAFFPGFVTPEIFGAVADGATDDSAEVQNAVNTGLPLHLGFKDYVFANITPPNPSDEIVIKGISSIKSVIYAPAGYSGYIINTTGRYDIRGLAFVGLKQDGCYGIGADGVGQVAGRPVLNDIRMFNFDECIKFGPEYEHPLGMDYEQIYCQAFLTAGINVSGVSGVASSGESAWNISSIITTNPNTTPVEYASTTTPNTPSSTQDTVDWAAEADSPEFGYLVLRSADGSTDWHVPPNWSSSNYTSTSFVASKSVAETWTYKVLRMTVGVNLRRGKAIDIDVIQNEYTGIGLLLNDCKVVSVGTHYFEIRNTLGARGGFAGIYASTCNAVTVNSFWGEELGYNVFAGPNSKITVNSGQSSACVWSVFGSTGSTQQVIDYKNIQQGSTPQLWRSPVGNAQDYSYAGTIFTTDDHINSISHTTESGFEVRHRDVKKGGFYATGDGSRAELNELQLEITDKAAAPIFDGSAGVTTLTSGVSANILTIDLDGTNDSGSLIIEYKVKTLASVAYRQSESGQLRINTLNTAASVPSSNATKVGSSQIIQSGTLAVSFATSNSAGQTIVSCTATTSLSSPTITIEIVKIGVIGNVMQVTQL